MQDASDVGARGSTVEPVVEQSDSFSPATERNNSIEQQTVASAGPQIVLHPSEGLERSSRPLFQSSRGLGSSVSSEYSSSHESLDLDHLVTVDPLDEIDIPKSIKCFFHITFDGAPAPGVAKSLTIDYTEPNSYQKVERFSQDVAREAPSDRPLAGQINFKYGNCTVVGDHVENIGVPLTTKEDWDSVCTILASYWRSDPHRSLHVDIFRDYFSYRSRAASEVSFAATKRREIHNLIKYASDDRKYIPRTALMRFNSLQNIREIIIEDDRLDIRSEEKEIFIQKVQSSAPCLLALCVYAGLKMKCLSILLEHFSDASLPLQRQDCCHNGQCGPDFSSLVDMQGGFMAARFDDIGGHQDFHHSVVIPVHLISVEDGQDAVMKAGRRKDLEEEKANSSHVIDHTKERACCGSGAYSKVYRVRIDPDHHRLSKNKDVDFALKEFKDRPDRGDNDFQKELKVLNELRKYPLRHIVTHLATWTQSGRYYMLFPYAQCNLRQYMKWVQFGDPTKENILWLIRQFRGLAEALKDIHDLSGAGALQSAPNLGAPLGGERRAGYHHDLKPENILYYMPANNFLISDFGSGKIHTYRSGSYNTSSANGTLTYEPPEAAKPGRKTSRPYDMWSLGCVFLELLIWAVLGFQSVEDFRSKRVDRRYPESETNFVQDDAFWQMLPNGSIRVRESVESCILALREGILRQSNQPFKEILELILKMLDMDKETRIPALDLYDTLDRIYNQKKIDLKNVKDDSLPDRQIAEERSDYLPRLSLNPPDRRSLDRPREGAAIASRNPGNATGDFLTASPTSSHFPQTSHRRNSSTSEFIGRSRNVSNASTNMSTHGRRGSFDER